MNPTRPDNRAAQRYEVDAPVIGAIGNTNFEGRLKDISATGAAIVGVEASGYENDQFVKLHMHGMEPRTGYIKRQIPEGFAMQFDESKDEAERRSEVQAMLRALGPGALKA